MAEKKTPGLIKLYLAYREEGFTVEETANRLGLTLEEAKIIEEGLEDIKEELEEMEKPKEEAEEPKKEIKIKIKGQNPNNPNMEEEKKEIAKKIYEELNESEKFGLMFGLFPIRIADKIKDKEIAAELIRIATKERRPDWLSSNPSNPENPKRKSLEDYPYAMEIRGEYYGLTEEGWIARFDVPPPYGEPSEDWKVYGVSRHFARSSPDLYWEDIKRELDKGNSVEGYLWDIDHGSIRKWEGSYAGRTPKVKIWKQKGGNPSNPEPKGISWVEIADYCQGEWERETLDLIEFKKKAPKEFYERFKKYWEEETGEDLEDRIKTKDPLYTTLYTLEALKDEYLEVAEESGVPEPYISYLDAEAMIRDDEMSGYLYTIKFGGVTMYYRPLMA